MERIDDEGKLKKIDNVASAFARLKRKNGIRKPLKYFRKTSATLLKSNKDYRGLDVLFLGHAPWAPRAASARAVSIPNPPDAPVTAATRPSRSTSASTSSVVEEASKTGRSPAVMIER